MYGKMYKALSLQGINILRCTDNLHVQQNMVT
jgi:hypothetical protein